MISGFTGEELLCSLYALVRLAGQGVCKNLYPAAVRPEGNPAARALVDQYFAPTDAAWRGLGNPPNGLPPVWHGLYPRHPAGRLYGVR